MILPRDASDRLVHAPEGRIERLVEIMARLRDPASGCPWDLEQDFASIAPYTIEEAHEVADAIDRRAWGDLKGELGDLLFQAVYHARMAEEAGHFDFADVVRGVSDKMVARHPHVFGDENADKTAAEQTRDWERMKAAERAGVSCFALTVSVLKMFGSASAASILATMPLMRSISASAAATA